MTDPGFEMTDAVFDISGDTLPASYPYPLWHALVRHLPALEDNIFAGVIPLRTATSEAGMLLPKRAKLVLRLTPSLCPEFTRLAGQPLDIGGVTLQLGGGKLRKILPYPTLHAHLVTGADDEIEFLQQVAAQLDELGITGQLLCGMRNVMHTPDHSIHGYSLVIHDLKAEDSLRLQYRGLGAERRYGCGIFVPYKVITDLNG